MVLEVQGHSADTYLASGEGFMLLQLMAGSGRGCGCRQKEHMYKRDQGKVLGLQPTLPRELTWSLQKYINLFMRAVSPCPNYFLHVLPSNTVTLGTKPQHETEWG
jgi:hypothetical protein